MMPDVVLHNLFLFVNDAGLSSENRKCIPFMSSFIIVVQIAKYWWSQQPTISWGTFFKKFLADTCPFLGPLVPLFWISGDVSSGFQSQSGFCLIPYFCWNLWCYTCWPHGGWRTAGHFPTCMCRGRTWLGFECAIARTEDERATIVPATRLLISWGTYLLCNMK